MEEEPLNLRSINNQFPVLATHQHPRQPRFQEWVPLDRELLKIFWNQQTIHYLTFALFVDRWFWEELHKTIFFLFFIILAKNFTPNHTSWRFSCILGATTSWEASVIINRFKPHVICIFARSSQVDEAKADLNSGLDLHSKDLDLDLDLDLHSKDGQFCVDISDFLDLQWVEKEVEECATAFEQRCEVKTQEVCLTVNETLCEVSNNAVLEIPVIRIMKSKRRRS